MQFSWPFRCVGGCRLRGKRSSESRSRRTWRVVYMRAWDQRRGTRTPQIGKLQGTSHTKTLFGRFRKKFLPWPQSFEHNAARRQVYWLPCCTGFGATSEFIWSCFRYRRPSSGATLRQSTADVAVSFVRGYARNMFSKGSQRSLIRTDFPLETQAFQVDSGSHRTGAGASGAGAPQELCFTLPEGPMLEEAGEVFWVPEALCWRGATELVPTPRKS